MCVVPSCVASPVFPLATTVWSLDRYARSHLQRAHEVVLTVQTLDIIVKLIGTDGLRITAAVVGYSIIALHSHFVVSQ